MTSRTWLGTFGLIALVAGMAIAQEKAATKTKPAAALIQEAVQAANDGDLTKGIKLADQALQAEPENRMGLFVVGMLSSMHASEVDNKAERIALLHKVTSIADQLKAKVKQPNANEKRLIMAADMGEARALSLEGKPELALKKIKEALAAGSEDFEALETEADLAPVRALPGFRTMVARAVEASVASELAASHAFPFDFDLKDTDQKPFKLADLKGKVAIVDVWGTWCPPCRKEIPHFVELYQEYQPKGLEIVGINCNEEGSPDEVRKTIKEFAKSNKMTYRCVINNEEDRTEGKIPGFQGYPTTLFLDRTGKVRLTLVGYTPKAKLEAIITTLLAEPAK